jgi:hypothetical protein
MKRIILKINASGKIEAFSTLTKLFEKHPEIKKLKDKIYYKTSRIKVDFIGDGYVIKRIKIN